MKIKALVNGKETVVEVMESYKSGICNETIMFDGSINFNGNRVAVTVSETEVLEVIGATYKFEYLGDAEQRGSDAEHNRVAWITVTAEGKGCAESAFEMLVKRLEAKTGELEWSGCGIDDEGKFGDCFVVENKKEADRIKKKYMSIKKKGA